MVMKRIIGAKFQRSECLPFHAVLKHASFDLFFDRVRELHAFVREKLYAIVLIGIVRSGHNDTDVEIVLANETGDSRSSQNPG